MSFLSDLFVGSDPEAVDTRLPREASGNRWWKTFGQMYDEGSPLDPAGLASKTSSVLDQMMGFQPVIDAQGNQTGFMSSVLANAPVTVNFNGKSYRVTPKWARELPLQYVSAVDTMLDPFHTAGMKLEDLRRGAASAGSDGFMQTFLNSTAGNLGKGLAGGLAGLVTG